MRAKEAKDKKRAVISPILLEIIALIVLPRVSSVVSKKLSDYADKPKPKARAKK